MSYTYEWKPEYSVGSKTLDIQHQKLLMLCKRVSDYQCDSSKRSIETFHSILNDLAFYTKKHFQTEEDVLRLNGNPKLDEQKGLHNEYESRLVDFLNAAMSGEIITEPLQEFLGKWWVNHILTSDVQYRNHTARKNESTSTLAP